MSSTSSYPPPPSFSHHPHPSSSLDSNPSRNFNLQYRSQTKALNIPPPHNAMPGGNPDNVNAPPSPPPSTSRRSSILGLFGIGLPSTSPPLTNPTRDDMMPALSHSPSNSSADSSSFSTSPQSVTSGMGMSFQPGPSSLPTSTSTSVSNSPTSQWTAPKSVPLRTIPLREVDEHAHDHHQPHTGYDQSHHHVDMEGKDCAFSYPAVGWSMSPPGMGPGARRLSLGAGGGVKNWLEGVSSPAGSGSAGGDANGGFGSGGGIEGSGSGSGFGAGSGLGVFGRLRSGSIGSSAAAGYGRMDPNRSFPPGGGGGGGSYEPATSPVTAPEAPAPTQATRRTDGPPSPPTAATSSAAAEASPPDERRSRRRSRNASNSGVRKLSPMGERMLRAEGWGH